MHRPPVLVLCAFVCTLAGCSTAPSAGDGAGDTAAAPGERRYTGGETCRAEHGGVRLVMSYDRAAKAFFGTLENTTTAPVSGVRVTVHWSAGEGLVPSRIDLGPGETRKIRLGTGHIAFSWWRAEVQGGSS